MKFLREKEVTVKFLGESEVIVEFPGENIVTMKFLGENEVIVKILGGKEVILKFLGGKEVTVKFLREKKVTMKFLGEKEVTVKFLGEKKVMVKPSEEKEVIVIDEDPFTPTTSINIAATNSRAILNAKKARRFSLSAKVITVWIPKKYLTYKNDLAAKRKVSTSREIGKKGRYPYYPFEDSKHKAKNKNFSKGNVVTP